MKLIYKKGTNRPMTMGIQQVVGAEIDGFFGSKTEGLVKQFQKSVGLKETGICDLPTLEKMYPDMDVKYRIFEVTCCFEVGTPDYCKSAWGKKTKIDDGAGWNYGPMQHNKFGSLQFMKKKYGFDSPDDWYGTPAGAVGQLWYFENKILNYASEFASKIGDPSDLTILLISDAITQGGGAYPTKPPVLWDDWIYPKELIPQIQELYRKYQVRTAFDSALRLVESSGEMYAELHPRSGNKKFLSDQLARRRCAFRGKGKVHGTEYNLCDFGLRPC